MENIYIPLDDNSDKKHIRILMVIFGFFCLFTSGWWATYILKSPESEKVFWLATIFLFLFGLYQVYAGLGYAKRYISIKGPDIIIRQNGFLKPVILNPDVIEKIEIGSMDIIFRRKGKNRLRLKLGLKYPDLGQNIKDQVVLYGENNDIEIFFNNQAL